MFDLLLQHNMKENLTKSGSNYFAAYIQEVIVNDDSSKDSAAQVDIVVK
jgi:hypothetical protein